LALYEITLRQRYYDQLCVNVFSYHVPAGVGVTPTALELLTLAGFIASGDPLEFDADTLAYQLWLWQNSGVTFLTAEARELYSVSDFYEAAYSPAIPGNLAATDSAPPFVAYGLYTARVRLDIRRGFKRFVGVSENLIDPGGELGAAVLAGMADLAEAMSAILDGATANYRPCVISREKIVDEETGAVSYQLYPTEAEQEEHIAFPVVWSPYDQVRSQVSRQYGRGD